MKIIFKDKDHSFTDTELIDILEEHGYENAEYIVENIMASAEYLAQYRYTFDWAGVVGWLYQRIFVRYWGDSRAYNKFKDEAANYLEIVKAIYQLINKGIYIRKENDTEDNTN